MLIDLDSWEIKVSSALKCKIFFLKYVQRDEIMKPTPQAKTKMKTRKRRKEEEKQMKDRIQHQVSKRLCRPEKKKERKKRETRTTPFVKV